MCSSDLENKNMHTQVHTVTLSNYEVLLNGVGQLFHINQSIFPLHSKMTRYFIHCIKDPVTKSALDDLERLERAWFESIA